MEENFVIHDLTVVIVCAAAVTVIFKALRLPVLLGYLVSGFLVGPNFLENSPVADIDTINELSELGVAFLMFYIGLEFDLRKLQRTLAPSLLTVLTVTTVMMFVGILTAPMLGWSSVTGIFLGCILAISSTMITVPILKEQNALKSNFAQLAIGILIFEDILAIIVLVVLTGVGAKGYFEWNTAWQMVFFVGVFVMMVFFVGKLAAPKLLNLLKRFGSPEMVTVTAVALLLGIGELAIDFNFSIALGAFLAGSILSQNELAQEIEHAIEPLRNLFTAVFFVTVGMRINPIYLQKYWVSIVLLTIIVVVGKTVITWFSLFLAGQKPRTAFRAALCKAQIGEFSFVIAALGLQQGIADEGIAAVSVGIAVGAIMVVPFLSNRAVDIYDWITPRLPAGLSAFGQFYRNYLTMVREHVGKSMFIKLVKRPLLQIVGYFLLFNGIIIIAFMSGNYITRNPDIVEYSTLLRNAIWVISALLCLPFLIAIVRNLEVILILITESALSNRASKIFKRGKMRNMLNTILLCIFVMIMGGLYISAASPFLPRGVGLLAFIALIVSLGFFLWRYIVRVNSRIENLFIQSFNYEVACEKTTNRVRALKDFAERYPWPIKLHDCLVESGTLACGMKLEDIKLQERTGSTIIGISRDSYTTYNPGPGTPLFPGDHVIIIGDEEQMKAARHILSEKLPEGTDVHEQGRFKIDKVFLTGQSPMIGHTLADANIRRKFRVNVIGIQRGEKQITAPSADEVLKQDDIVVVVGNTSRIKEFRDQVEL